MPHKHHRRSIRLSHVDYSVPGFYFITMCTKNREHLFGEIRGGEMQLSKIGEIAHQCWLEIPNHFSNVIIDEFVVMPNHVHGIIGIVENKSYDRRGMACHAPTTPTDPIRQFAKPIVGSLATIVGSYKSAVTKQINQLRDTPANPIWQRNYYEHIIRNDDSLDHIRQYIRHNPFNWSTDIENPINQTQKMSNFKTLFRVLLF